MSHTTTRRPRQLSRKRVKELARKGQWWDDGQKWWGVREVDRRNGEVRLERQGDEPQTVTFGQLASRFTISEDGR